MLRTVTVGAFALATLIPAAAASQVTVDTDEARRTARAEILTEQAYLAAGQRHDFATAASWLREAASLREVGSESVRSLMDAGHFHFYAQRSLDAVSAFQSAGRQALELGDGDTAARAFRNGAFAAERAGDPLTARILMARSQSIEAELAVSRVSVVTTQDR